MSYLYTIIHASRQRPQQARSTANKWLNAIINDKNAEYILSLDVDDPTLSDYLDLFYDFGLTDQLNILLVNRNKSSVEAINKAAERASYFMIVISDDTDVPAFGSSWIYKINKIAYENKDWILKTQDGIQDWIITMPVMDRTYYNRFGYIYHPDYQHMFCDTELSCVADLTGRRITSDLMFKHNHYSVINKNPDEISKRADATWKQGEELFRERYRRNFDLKPEEIKGEIKNKGMIDWITK